ncbi:MAG: HIT family protein [Lachnospiraceae bacterium]|nr:HIT family protein [Lachnospiraceae bacterium]
MSDCLFCKIANGEFDSFTVYEDNDFRAIMDIAPASRGHIIILPKTHATDIFDLDEVIASKIYVVAKKLAKAVKEVTGCDGVNVLQNNGEAAGQTVFHLHMHVIPRWNDDNIKILWEQTEVEKDVLKELAEDIKGIVK